MRILHLASSHRWTGAAEPASDLAQEQIRLGHEAELACIAGHSFARRAGKRKIPVIESLHFAGGMHLAAIAADIGELRRLAAERKYDVVHCHLSHDHWLAAAALRGFGFGGARGNGPILVRTIHRDVTPAADPLHRRLFAKATDLTICVSEEGRRDLTAKLGVAPARTAFIRGAVSLKRYHPVLDRMANRREWKIEETAPVAGIVARMQPHRGHLEFISTLEEVARTVPGAVYIVAGRGENQDRVRAAAAAHPLSAQLRLVGYRKKDLALTYAAMDVSILLARGSDGTCRAMLEAMACGRPVIGVRARAIAETIEPGKTGWLVDPANLKTELPRALIEALGNPARTREMGRAARARVEELFTQRRRAEETLAAYARVGAL